ncbi:MAG: hypothetical protein MJZ77_08575 [Bacteroidales bacterium]|nr:hypothetical protein [Bacteroidales bacterium]MCQ2296937.1 hypothetical protein [Bacteroidales bacterium]
MHKTLTTIALIAVLGTMAVSCQKENENKFTWTDPGISWTDYNSVHNFHYHFRLDSLDMMEHLGDTILIEAYNVDHGLDNNLCISDQAIAYPRTDFVMPLDTPDSVVQWGAQHFNEKVRVVGTLQYEPDMWDFFGPQLMFVDVKLVDELP